MSVAVGNNRMFGGVSMVNGVFYFSCVSALRFMPPTAKIYCEINQPIPIQLFHSRCSHDVGNIGCSIAPPFTRRVEMFCFETVTRAQSGEGCGGKVCPAPVSYTHLRDHET